MAELSALRNKVSALRINVPSDNGVCSSFFVEPLEWMGPFILGHKDGKVKIIIMASDNTITPLYFTK